MEDMERDAELWKQAEWGNSDPKDMWGITTPPTPTPGLLQSCGRQRFLTSRWWVISPQACRQKAAPGPPHPWPMLSFPPWAGRLVPGAGMWSELSSTVLEEGALQEGGQLRPVVLVDKAVVHELGGQVLGAVGWEQVISELSV